MLLNYSNYNNNKMQLSSKQRKVLFFFIAERVLSPSFMREYKIDLLGIIYEIRLIEIYITNTVSGTKVFILESHCKCF